MKKKTKKYLLIIACVLFGVNFIISCGMALKTPEFKGVIVDDVTGEPIKDARLYAEWERTVASPGGLSSGGTSKVLRLRTEEAGAFRIPSYIVLNLFPYPIGQGGVFFLKVYAHGYKIKGYYFNNNEQINKPKYKELKSGYRDVKVPMKKLDDAQKYFFQVGERVSFSGKDYYLEDLRYFISTFPDSKWTDNAQYEIGRFYEKQGEYSKALEEYRFLINKYPESGQVSHCLEAIKRIEMKIKGREK
jgi:hypothetical protein